MYLRLLTAFLVYLNTVVLTPAGTFKHIAIDGDFTDWAGVPIAYTDPSEPGADAGTDFKDVWIAHDNDYLYVRVSFYNSGDLLRSQNNIFINGDGDSSTGFNILGTGSEMVIQGGTGYQEKNGGFNDGSTVQDLGWASAPEGATNQFEFRVSRKAKFEDGTAVLTSNTIGILLETENQNYNQVDTAKDDGPIEYTMDAAPPVASGVSELISLTGTNWRFNRSGTDLGSAWREIGYDDTQTGWESGKGLFGKTPNPANYPAPITTPFSDNTVTHYFRAKFAWNLDPAGISLLASNFVSDGALVYLNGAEVARVRMPEGEVSAATTATGPNSKAGQVELIDLPPNALVVGDNVLAVEVHQSANDTSELVFGLSLLASDRLPAAIVAPSEPQTLVIDEGSPATFTVKARGAEPITYQWFDGTTLIQGATNSTYTIPAVTQNDAGQYQVKVSNAGAQNVASPIFTLQTKAVPVTIADSTLPADVTVTEGNPASFKVAVAGSTPISFQWFKDDLPLTDATNSSYSIDIVLTNNAGLYTCVVSNRITAPLKSRAAQLTVLPDKVAPTLTAVSGGGTRVLLTFSEPMDTNALAPSQFSVTPSTTVTSAHLSADDSAVVVLQCSPLTFGTNYTVAVTGAKDRFGNPVAASTTKPFRATILIDGDFSDWAGLPLAYSDPEDAGPETGAHSDYKDIWVTSDNDYIYLHFTLWQPSDPFVFYNNIFIDADNDPTTGYSFNGIGSDMLIQSGAAYEEQPTLFNAGNVDDLDWLAAPNPPGTEFEVRFSRLAKYANADAGGLVFKTNSIAFVLESENTAFQAKETAPDAGSGGITHTLLNFAPLDLGTMTITSQSGGVKITWNSTSGKLQESASLSPIAWKDVPNASSPYSVPMGGKEHYYRLTAP